jgi:xylan 1,4-beta-xylosidase
MKLAKHITLFFFTLSVISTLSYAQQKTYCNPLNIDYGYTPIPGFAQWGRHRATADPVIVNYKGDFYLFSTNQKGYWWSSDLHGIPALTMISVHRVLASLAIP